MKRLYIALLALSLIWGTSFLFIKVLVTSLTVWEVVFWRCAFGSIVLWALFLWKEKVSFRHLPWGALLLVGLVNNAIPWGLIAFSELYLSSSLASVLNATTPIFTGIIGFVVFSRKLRAIQWTGILLGFIGIVVLSDLHSGGVWSANLLGVGTMLLAAMCYGFSSQYTKRKLSHLPSLAIASITLTFASFYSLTFAYINGTMNWAIIQQPGIIGSFIGLGAFGSGFAIFLLYYLIQKGSAEFAMTVTYLVPISAILWGFIFLDETITSNMLLGLVLVFFGVYLTTEKRKRKREIQHDKTYGVS